MNKVVVTGIGAITPLGNGIKQFWQNISKGKNGVNFITHFDTTNFNTKIAAEVDFDLKNYFTTKELNKMDRFTAFAIIASDEAIKQSKMSENNLDKNRIGVIIGSGIGGIQTLENEHKKLLKNPKRVSPYFIPSMISDIASGHISIKYGFQGPNYCVVSACSTGSHAIGDAYRMIKHGYADIIVAGGSEAGITPLSIAGFTNMKALSQNNDVHTSCRPFDFNRNGFVMGEGSGILILEDLNHALKRNANIIAEIIGYGATADAFHLTSPSLTGSGAKRSMLNALTEAKINYKKIDYINTHGTSTKYNDKIETQAIKEVFKEHSYKIALSSTKSMTGHLLGAAGAIEAIVSILSINNSLIPPTINFETPDPDCDLDYTFNIAANKKVNYSLSNTFGFGGHNASLIFKRFNS